METWGGKYSKARNDEKVNAVLRWLFQFDVSTRKLLCAMLGLSTDRGQGAFFARLIDLGLIELTHSPLIRHHVYRLTNQGWEWAIMRFGFDASTSKRRYISPAVQVHDLTVQKMVIERMDGLVNYFAERHIHTGKAGTMPDALLEYQDHSVALEVELSHKNTARVYYTYLSHLRNIKEGKYQKVLYVFSNPDLLETYRDRFLAKSWPVYKVDPRGRLTRVKTGDDAHGRPVYQTYALGEQNHHLFEFIMGEPYR